METDMFVLKGCPRCGGDLFAGIDDDYTCMQCGKDIDASAVTAHLTGTDAQRRVRVAALSGR